MLFIATTVTGMEKCDCSTANFFDRQSLGNLWEADEAGLRLARGLELKDRVAPMK